MGKSEALNLPHFNHLPKLAFSFWRPFEEHRLDMGNYNL